MPNPQPCPHLLSSCPHLLYCPAQVVLWDLVADAARRVADEVQRSNPKSKVFVYAVDVSKPKDVSEAAARVQRRNGRARQRRHAVPRRRRTVIYVTG